MVKIFLDLIENGMYTIERVPEQWRAAVEAALDKDTDGNDAMS